MAFRKFMKAERVESADAKVKSFLRESSAKRVKDLSDEQLRKLRERLNR